MNCRRETYACTHTPARIHWLQRLALYIKTPNNNMFRIIQQKMGPNLNTPLTHFSFDFTLIYKPRNPVIQVTVSLCDAEVPRLPVSWRSSGDKRWPRAIPLAPAQLSLVHCLVPVVPGILQCGCTQHSLLLCGKAGVCYGPPHHLKADSSPVPYGKQFSSFFFLYHPITLSV